MANDPNRPEGVEPQSYGSEQDWTEGTTGQDVERTPSRTSRHDERFYRDRGDSGSSAGEAPAGTHMDAPRPAADTANSEVVGAGGKKLPETNETRQSWFRDRDYR